MTAPTMQFRAMYNATTIPVLEQVVNFTQARHSLLTGNIANFDTPHYKARDISVADFRERLAYAIKRKHETPPGPNHAPYPYKPPNRPFGEEWPTDHPILYHDKNNVGMEYQVVEMVKNHLEHNLALNIMKHQMDLLETAIRGQV